MANVCCSIEMEPRTLNEGQLNYAREVAADVVQKMEPNEASTIFTEGMKPAQIKGMEQMDEKEYQLHKLVECKEKAPVIERPCQCVCTPTVIESPEQIQLKEPLSAPF